MYKDSAYVQKAEWGEMKGITEVLGGQDGEPFIRLSAWLKVTQQGRGRVAFLGDSHTLSPGELTTLPHPHHPLDTRDFMYPILAHSFTPLLSSSCSNVLPLFPYLQLASCPSLAEILPPPGSFPSCLSWHTSLHITQHSQI